MNKFVSLTDALSLLITHVRVRSDVIWSRHFVFFFNEKRVGLVLVWYTLCTNQSTIERIFAKGSADL